MKTGGVPEIQPVNKLLKRLGMEEVPIDDNPVAVLFSCVEKLAERIEKLEGINEKD